MKMSTEIKQLQAEIEKLETHSNERGREITRLRAENELLQEAIIEAVAWHDKAEIAARNQGLVFAASQHVKQARLLRAAQIGEEVP